MIYDFVVDCETGTRYQTEHFDDVATALTYYENKMFEGWEYITLRKRTMDPVTMKDVYEDLYTYEGD